MIKSRQSAPHWRDQFPELAQQDPLLDVLRLIRVAPPASGPVFNLFDVLDASFPRPFRTHAPDTPERSFDEAWLLAVFEALRTADRPRYSFLLRSRLSAAGATRIHFALTQAQIWLEARL